VKVKVRVGMGLGEGLGVGRGVGAGVRFGVGLSVGSFVATGVTLAIDDEGVGPGGGTRARLDAKVFADAVGCDNPEPGAGPEATLSAPIVTRTAAAIVTL
jgi:hypothetical protein